MTSAVNRPGFLIGSMLHVWTTFGIVFGFKQEECLYVDQDHDNLLSPSTFSPMQEADFSAVPVLDYSLITSPSKSPEESRSLFLSQLRHAVTCLGSFYLTNHGIPSTILDPVAQYVPKFFDQSQEEKDKLALANSQHFLGYSRLGGEITKGKVDWVEQIAIGNKFECRWTEQGERTAEFWKFWGPSQVCLSHRRTTSLINENFSGPMRRSLDLTWLASRRLSYPIFPP
jgi:non-haem dioxygenase in morphine synthesis N-terminal